MSKTVRTFLCCAVFVLTCLLFTVPAISDETAIPLNQYGIRSTNPYVADRFIENGKEIDMVIVPSRPEPPEGFSPRVVRVPEPDIEAGINTIPNVPAMTWCFGCSATSAAMMYGHYDNEGYTNMYTGPTNGGVFPMTNETWGTVDINGETRALCPLSATRQGLDGRATKGHVDDYWIKYGSEGSDPFIGNWTEHAYGDCTGDYMGTNQSLLENTDGSTIFYNYRDGTPLYDYTGSEPEYRDGCHGLRDFAESRGYTVVTNFSQYIYGYNENTQGFTFTDFKDEIDAGRPVLIQVTGHTMLGYGYHDDGSIVYIHDTWDYSDHSMFWGGVYAGMTHYGVTVLRLDPAPGLTVFPGDGLSSIGNAGGPFSPAGIVYTLENRTAGAIDYTVSKGEPWVSLSSSGGTLAGHATTDVTVSINSNADSLANGSYTDTVTFTNTTDHEGDTTREVTLTVGILTLRYAWNMDSDPGWNTEGLWEWGQPMGSGGQYGNPDPTSGCTGDNVYGYNLSGDYENDLPERRLTTGAIDCREMSQVTLKFLRWLGVESPLYDHAYVRVSNDGSTWSTVWENATSVTDSSWKIQEFDISDIADGQATVYLRWTMGTTDSLVRYCGWNIDDVEIWAVNEASSSHRNLPFLPLLLLNNRAE